MKESPPPSHFRTTEVGELPCSGGHLAHVTVKSPALHGRGDCSLYIPDQAKELPSVPVVILLHGVYGSHWAWMLKGGAHTTLQAMIDSGKIAPMILATPSDGLWGDGSGYLAHSGKDFERWIVEDVPHLVHEVSGNPIDTPHFIAGLSMGGYGALRIGAKHPDRFRAFAGHSSITVFEELRHFVEEPLTAYQNIQTDLLSVFETIRHAGAALRPFRFDCGSDDPLLAGNRRLHKQLTEAGIPHSYEEFPGGHDWSYWTESLPECLRFFLSAHL